SSLDTLNSKVDEINNDNASIIDAINACCASTADALQSISQLESTQFISTSDQLILANSSLDTLNSKVDDINMDNTSIIDAINACCASTADALQSISQLESNHFVSITNDLQSLSQFDANQFVSVLEGLLTINDAIL